MCGIAGILNRKSVLPPLWIHESVKLIRHRGPDDEGYLAVDLGSANTPAIPLWGADSQTRNGHCIDTYDGSANLYLGHRRLSILDLSACGHQPMSYGEDLWIVYNGEVFNYLELRAELKDQGYAFHTQSDTEVVLAAYDCWGEQCVTRFNGDWGFCIYDAKRQRLFISRDRYGIKPLYYFADEQHLAFASEIKALLALPFVPKKLNRSKAFHYCALHCRDHTEETLFDGILQVQPGCNLTVDLRSGTVEKRPYYQLAYCEEIGTYDHAKALEYAAEIRELLFDAVRVRLRADVPVGTCLSGGLDSASIVTIMGQLLGAETRPTVQNTFTASFPGERIDETVHARSVTESLDAQAHYVFPSREGYREQIPAILDHQDEPFGSATIYSQWEVMKEASRHVKVVLDGQGGDEVFGGYWDNRASFLTQLLRAGRLGAFASELTWAIRHAGVDKTWQVLKPLPFFALPKSLKLHVYRWRFRGDIERSIRDFGADAEGGWHHIWEKFSPHANELLMYHLTAHSLPFLLKAEDRNSMAHSVEARAPFTDYRLVDYLFSLPSAFKIHQGWTKWLLRLAMQDILPQEIVWRKDKLGFATPGWTTRREEWDTWFQQFFPESTQAPPSVDGIR